VRVEEYTADVLAQLKAAGVTPRIVQIGNEIDGGLLWPLGKVGGAGYDAPENHERFGRLLKAGVRGVRSATVSADSVRVMLHYWGASVSGTQWFSRCAGVPYDLIGSALPLGAAASRLR
jgi:arabinogalactan endo-1,4-beta-galactosidase